MEPQKSKEKDEEYKMKECLDKINYLAQWRNGTSKPKATQALAKELFLSRLIRLVLS